MTAADDRKHQTQVATLAAIGAILANGAFFFLSSAYWADRARRFGPQELTFTTGSRVHFAEFTAVVALAAIAVVFAPRLMAHAISAVAAAAALVAAYFSFDHGLPNVVPASCLLLGVGIPAFAAFTWMTRSRAAWASLVNLLGILGVVTLFGAPKVAHLLGLSLWTAMIAPGVLACAVAALFNDRAAYTK